MDQPASGRRKAAFRLYGQLGWVHEVALVGLGANERMFHVIQKGLTNMPLNLPTQAKTILLEAMGKILEQGVAMTDAISAATTTDDAGAAVPPEVTQSLTQLGEMFLALAAQFGAPDAEVDVDMGNMDVAPEEKAAAVDLAKSIVKGLITTYRSTQKSKAGGMKLTLPAFLKVQSSVMETLWGMWKDLGPLFDAAGLTGASGGGAEGGADAGAGGDGAAAPATKSLDAINAELRDLRSRIEKIGQRRQPSNAMGDQGLDGRPPRGEDEGRDRGKSKYGPGVDISARVVEKLRKSGQRPALDRED